MSKIIRSSGDYTIESAPAGSITLTTGALSVGDSGEIFLAADATGIDTAAGNSYKIDGVAVNVPAGGTANQVLEKVDGTDYNVQWGTSAGGISNVVEDTTPQLGGDLDVNGFDIEALINNDVTIVTTGTGKLGLSTPLVLQSAVVPNIAASEVAVYTGTDTGGGTQIHFKNDTDTGELVSKAKAFAFALIF